MCVLDFNSSRRQCIPLVEFAYNDLYRFTIGMALYEALQDRPRGSPTCWMEVGDDKFLELEMIRDTSSKIELIRNRSRIAQDR